MVSISLRAYLNEINDMIDQRQIDEAIANCRHILKSYPKHVDTYRLLGKAYLEEQRYSDASDILQRVLSSVPEDFISQVGMSIIREDEGNLDSAVYHMERAFETQPSNHAIQDELRRLHSQRDGVELKRVRLTRGALARMYAHGNLYEQAISELMAALSEDPNRYDLQSLLADMYYNTDKKVDAAETCTKILEKLPHCLNANRLLTTILEESGRPEEASRYRQRWAALDPYATFVSEQYSLIEQVPDNQVTLDRFEWDPASLMDAETGQPAWASSLGVSLSSEEETSEPLPDWLSEGIGQPDETPLDMDADLDEEEYPPTEMLPESLAASFEDDSSTIDGDHIDLFPSANLGLEEDSEEDWLASIESGEESTSSEEEDLFAGMAGDDEAGDDWLTSTETIESTEEPDTSTVGASDEDDWLASLDTAGDEAAQVEMVEETDIFATPTDEESSSDDWLASLETSDEEQPPAVIAEEEADTDDWLGSLESAADELAGDISEETEEEAELPDFLKDAGWEPSSGTVDEAEPVPYEADDEAREPEEDIAEAEIPDWIQKMAPTEDTSPDSDLEAEADPEWMKSMQAPSDADSPTWLKELGDPETVEEEDAVETPPAAEEFAEPEEELPVSPETADEPSIGAEIEADEMDMAWLENLAAKQGIPDEELVTSAEKRAEITDDHTPTTGTLEESTVAEEPTADTDWLSQLGQDEDEEVVAEEIEPVGETTARWLSEIAEDEEISPQPGVEDDDTISRFLADQDSESAEGELAPTPVETEPETASPVDEEADDFDMDWLSEISEEAAAEAEAEAEALVEDILEIAAEEEVEEAEEDWLAALDQPEAETAQPEPAPPVDEEADDFDMDWLSEISEEAAAEADAEALVEDILETAEEEEEAEEDWLAALDQSEIGTIQPEPTSPVDEEADDFDMDWLSEISEEAAAEAEAEAESEALVDDVLETAAEEEEVAEDWLAALDQPETETVQPEPAPPVDEEADDFDMDWLSEISEEAAAEAEAEALVEDILEITKEEEEAEEAAEDWLATLDQPEAETAQPEPAPPVDEEADDFDMDWLSEISEEAAAEAEAVVEDILETAAEEEEIEEAAEDWLAALDQPEAKTAQPEPAPPVDEEADDFDMDWLSEISEEAAAEAEAVVEDILETAAEDEEIEEAAEDWLAALDQPEAKTAQPEPAPPVDEEVDDFDMDWLSEISEEAAAEAEAEVQASIVPEAEMPASTEDTAVDDDLLAELEDALTEITQPNDVAPVDEVLDDFDTSWLQDISEQAAAEAAADEGIETETPKEAVEETQAEEDLLADLDDAITDAGMPTTAILDDDLDDSLLDEALEAAEEIEAEEDIFAKIASGETELSPVDEEKDDFNTAWLDDIGAQAALEAAESELEETAEEAETAGEDWLAQIEAEDDLTRGDMISDTDAWLLSMEEEPESDEEAQPSIEDTGEWLGSLGIEQEETPAEPEFLESELKVAPEPELSTEEPDEEFPVPPAEPVLEEVTAEGVQPTEDDEWKPEVEIEAAPQETEAQPEPGPEAPVEPPVTPFDNALDTARQSVSDGDIDAALETYGKLIKKGKHIEEIISDLIDATLRHPINVRLWQTLGDAYMRIDNLQDALDAYSKAEDLLR